MAGTCIFCRILKGEIPSTKLYEDEHIVCILDAFPVSRGHALIIPKHHEVLLHKLPQAYASAIGKHLPRLAEAIMAVSGATDYNILNNNGKAAGQAVPHVHFHIIPKTADAGLLTELRQLESPMSKEEQAQFASQVQQRL